NSDHLSPITSSALAMGQSDRERPCACALFDFLPCLRLAVVTCIVQVIMLPCRLTCKVQATPPQLGKETAEAMSHAVLSRPDQRMSPVRLDPRLVAVLVFASWLALVILL